MALKLPPQNESPVPQPESAEPLGKSLAPPQFHLMAGDDTGAGGGPATAAPVAQAPANTPPQSPANAQGPQDAGQSQAQVGNSTVQGGDGEKDILEVPIKRKMNRDETIQYVEAYIFKGVPVGKLDWYGFDHAPYRVGSKIKVAVSRTSLDRLHKRQYLEKLPAKVQQLIHYDVSGANLRPEDIDRWYAIAKRVEGMDAAALAEFKSRVTRSGADIDAFEQSLNRFEGHEAKREANLEQLQTADTKLTGMEGLYKLYKQYKREFPYKPADNPDPKAAMDVSLPGDHNIKVAGITTTKTLLENKLTAALKENGFSSISEFEKYISEYQQAFTQEALNLVVIGLMKYQSGMQREEKRYQRRDERAALHGQLAGFRQDQAAAQDATNARYANFGKKPLNPFNNEGQAKFRESDNALAGVQKAAIDKAEGDLSALGAQHPLLNDHGLDNGSKLDRNKLAAANEDQLGEMLSQAASTRGRYAADAIKVLRKDPSKILGLPRAMNLAMPMMGVQKGTIQHMILSDAMGEYEDSKRLAGILATVVALGLTIISGGTASPLLAAAAAGGAAAISATMAIGEVNEYADQKQLSKVGLADDPSTVWLVVSLVGTAADIGQAVHAIKVLSPTAKALSTTADAAEALAAAKNFRNMLEALKTSDMLTAKAARSAEKALQAQLDYKLAVKDLMKITTGRTSANSVFDTEIYTTLSKMAVAKVKQGSHSFSAWLSELRAQKLIKEADLSGQGLLRLKSAWNEAEDTAKAEAQVVDTAADSANLADDVADASTDVATDVATTAADAAPGLNPKQIDFKKAVDDMEDITDAQRADLHAYNAQTPSKRLSPDKALEKLKAGLTYDPAKEGWIRKGKAAKPDAAPFAPTEAHQNGFFADVPAGQSRDGWKKFMRAKYDELHKQGKFVTSLVADKPALAPFTERLNVLVANGQIDKFNMVRAIRNTQLPPERMIKRLEEINALAKRGNRGVEQLVGDLAAGGNKQEGAEFVLRVIDDLDLWGTTAMFEEVSTKLGRRYDLVAGGKKWEFKSVSAIDIEKLGDQFLSDIQLLKEQNMLWVFDGTKMDKDTVLAKLNAILDGATEISDADKLLLKAKLNRTVIVY